MASKALFAVKADVALYFGTKNASIASAQSALVGVTADPATVNATCLLQSPASRVGVSAGTSAG